MYTSNNKILITGGKTLSKSVTPFDFANLSLFVSANRQRRVADATAIDNFYDFSNTGNTGVGTSTARAQYKINTFNSNQPTFLFDGVNDQTLFSGTAYNIIRNTSSYCINLSFKRLRLATLETPLRIAGASGTNRVVISFNTDGTCTITLRNADGDSSVNITFSCNDSNEHLLTISMVSGLATIYLDALVVGQSTLPSSNVADVACTVFSLGSQNTAAPCNFHLDALSINKTSVTFSQIESIYKSWLKKGYL